jgi:hypothetical protein
MKLLIWDFDGTLAFREGLWSSAVAEVARAHIPGCQAVREDFLPHLRSGFPWHSPELPHTQIASAEEWWQHLSPVIAAALVKGTGIPARQAEQLVPVVHATSHGQGFQLGHARVREAASEELWSSAWRISGCGSHGHGGRQLRRRCSGCQSSWTVCNTRPTTECQRNGIPRIVGISHLRTRTRTRKRLM